MSVTGDEESVGGGFAVDVDASAPIMRVRVAGEIDLATAPQLQMVLDQVDVGTAIIVDLTDVTFLDSSGLNVLVRSHERLSGSAGDSAFRLVVSRPAIKRVLEITGLSEVFDTFSTPDEAAQGR